MKDEELMIQVDFSPNLIQSNSIPPDQASWLGRCPSQGSFGTHSSFVQR